MSALFPTIATKGPKLAPLYSLIELVSLSATFQARCGVTGDPDASSMLAFGEAEFQKRIFWPVVNLETFNVFPGVIVNIGNTFSYSFSAGGDRNYLHPSGSLELILVDEDRHVDDYETSCETFLEYEGLVISEIVANFGRDDYLTGSEVHQVVKPQFSYVESGESDNMRYWFVYYNVLWKN